MREHLADVDRPEAAGITLIRLHAAIHIVCDPVREVAVSGLSRHRPNHIRRRRGTR